MKILLVTIGGLGDAVLFSPVIKALHARYPQAWTHLLVASRLTRSAYTGAPGIDSIACLDANSRSSFQLGMKLFKFCIQSRRRYGGYDLGVYATGLNPKLPFALKTMAGVRRTVCGPNPPEYHTDLECNVALARRFDTGTSSADSFVPISEAAEAEANEILQASGIQVGDTLLAVYPSTDLPHRPRWPLSHFVEIIRRIRKQHAGGKIVVLGSRAEGRDWRVADAEHIVDANLAGRLSITASAAVLRRCSLAIGNDGGLMHVAGAVGCPMVAVMVNAPPTYSPPGLHTTVVRSQLECCSATYPIKPSWCHDTRCRQSVSFEEVYRACMEILTQTTNERIDPIV